LRYAYLGLASFLDCSLAGDVPQCPSIKQGWVVFEHGNIFDSMMIASSSAYGMHGIYFDFLAADSARYPGDPLVTNGKRTLHFCGGSRSMDTTIY
jgi:hypothetical protein